MKLAARSHWPLLFVGLGLVVTVFLLTSWFDDGRLSSDFAQIVSVSRNLLAGDGLTTSLIFYDTHYALGPAPVPQTVFPPGYSLVLAPLIGIGIPPSLAAFGVCLLAWLGTGYFLYRALVLTGFSSLLSASLIAIWFLASASWVNVLMCRSEVLLTFATTFGLYALARWQAGGGLRFGWLFALGIAAAFGALFRYQGFFFVAAVCLLFGLRFLHTRSMTRFKELLAVSVIPLTVVVSMVAYNSVVANAVSGGPMQKAESLNSIVDVAVAYYHEFSQILGISKAGLLSGGLAELSFLVLGVCVVWWLWSQVARKNESEPNKAPQLLLGLCLAYCFVAIALLTYLATLRSIGYVQDRYLATLLPFAIFMLAIAIRSYASLAARPAVWKPVAALSLAGLVIFGQFNTAGEQLEGLSGDTRFSDVRSAIQTPVGETTLGDMLRQEIDSGRNVFGHLAQRLGHELERPTYGLAASRFSSRVFDADEVLSLAEDFDLRYMILFPKHYEPDAIKNRNRHILTAMANGTVPEWLVPVVLDENFYLYEISMDSQ